MLIRLLAAPTIASKRSIWRQYDHQVGINTLVLPGSDAAVLRIKGTPRAVAVATDGNGRYGQLDPFLGGAMAVAEAARNVVCAGGRPLAVTNCLNFASPERPEIMWQFAQTVDGIAAACEALGIPVTGGNVSFYNETLGRAILPTPVIGVVGLLENAERRTTQWFKEEGDVVVLLGEPGGQLGGSEYLQTVHGRLAGVPAALDLDRERAVQTACLAAIEAGIVRSAHDSAEGGLAVALAECCVTGPQAIGAAVALPDGGRVDELLFGEAPSRILVTVAPGDAERLLRIVREWAVPSGSLAAWAEIGSRWGSESRCACRCPPRRSPTPSRTGCRGRSSSRSRRCRDGRQRGRMKTAWLDDDKFHDECGLFGVFDHPEAANLAYLGLYALQHRGQESAGIAATDGPTLHVEKAMGWVADVFSPERLRRLPGRAAIGHVRYSTAGSSTLRNAQPISASFSRGSIALGHNGNLVNAEALRKELEGLGAIFQSTSDSEVILHLIARADRQSLERTLTQALAQLSGAYSLVMLTPDTLIGCRDPHGFRPLVVGRLGKTWLLASETCALDLLEAEYVRDVEPGEIVLIDQNGLRSVKPFPAKKQLQCVFEYIYFARPDTTLWGQNVYQTRKSLGHRLAEEHPVEADIVIPVPDSGVGAALGFAEQSGIPFELGLIRNHYVGRTFIEPREGIRHFGVRVKLNPMRETIEGRRVVVVDDSIVRGTTSRKIVKMIRSVGAREVHLRISSPPIQWPCYYGIDTPTRKELIGSSHRVEEIRRYIGADSLGYLSLDGMLKAVGGDGGRFCHACFSGAYEVGFPKEDTAQLALFDVE